MKRTYRRLTSARRCGRGAGCVEVTAMSWRRGGGTAIGPIAHTSGERSPSGGAMHRMLSNQLPAHVGETVTVAGWVHRRPVLANVAFVVVRDRGGVLQVVTKEEDPPGEEQVVE